MKKIACFLLSFVIVFLVGCKNNSSNKWKVGVSMPNLALERWKKDGDNVKAMLEKSGFSVDLQYGEGNVNIQVNQVENMISKGCRALVVAPIDSKSMTNILKKAKEQNVVVIAYDRLITGTSDVDYYTTFDNLKVGEIQGKYIEDKLGLATSTKSYNIELFMGDQGDENARTFYEGVMRVIRPYIESGKLNVPSKQIEFEKVVTPGWETVKAQQRMDNIFTSKYATGTPLDAVIATSDCLSWGVINSLNSLYKNDTSKFPIVTGQDCDKANVTAIIEGKQSFSIFKDTRKLADSVVYIIQSLSEGKSVEVNDKIGYNNGVKDVPTITYEPILVTKDNYKEVLIDSGFYGEKEFN